MDRFFWWGQLANLCISGICSAIVVFAVNALTTAKAIDITIYGAMTFVVAYHVSMAVNFWRGWPHD